MYDNTERTTTMYNYKKDGKTCSTPNADIAVTRRDEDTDVQVETRTGEKVEHSTLTFN